MLARRTVVKGLAGLPLASVLMEPRLAQAAAARTQLVRISTAAGREVAGALAVPERKPAPGVLLIHEWWGLNDQIKAVAAELAGMGYLALAVDLFQGRLATTPDEANALIKAVREDEAVDTLTSWLQWLKNHQDSSRKTATLGWCFGGGWSLRAATESPVEAAIVYYGRCDLPAAQLSRLKGPVLGHFASRDQFIDQAMVGRFEQAMKQAGKTYQLYWYEADHAFANPTGSNYDKEDAQLAWRRTSEFLAATLG